jgi:hypothetical protein
VAAVSAGVAGERSASHVTVAVSCPASWAIATREQHTLGAATLAAFIARDGPPR